MKHILFYSVIVQIYGQDVEENGINCYSCDVTLDSNGNVLGIGSDECFRNEIHESFLLPCTGNQTFCVNELEVDWFFYGAQTYRMKRGCSAMAPPNECTILASHEDHMLKDCATGCTDDKCNADVEEVMKKFSANVGSKVASCLTCSYVEKDDGSVAGNKYCLDDEGHSEELYVDCPTYANIGCYTGSNSHYDRDDVLHEEVFKGCSSFDFETDLIRCNLFDNGEDATWGVCKQTCIEDNCNIGHQRPCLPGEDCSDDIETTTAPDNSTDTTDSAQRIAISLFNAFILFFIL